MKIAQCKIIDFQKVESYIIVAGTIYLMQGSGYDQQMDLVSTITHLRSTD